MKLSANDRAKLTAALTVLTDYRTEVVSVMRDLSAEPMGHAVRSFDAVCDGLRVLTAGAFPCPDGGNYPRTNRTLYVSEDDHCQCGLCVGCSRVHTCESCEAELRAGIR